MIENRPIGSFHLELYVKAYQDPKHIEAQKIYNKSLEFKLTQMNYIFCQNASSLYFELFKRNGENLGICGAVTYYLDQGTCIVLNWAIDRIYLGIGLEELLLYYMIENIGNYNNIDFLFQSFDENKRVETFINQYYGDVITDDCSSIPNDSNDFIPYLPYDKNTKNLLQKINDYIGNFSLYYAEDGNQTLKKFLVL